MFDVLFYLYENYHHPEACPPQPLLLRKLAAAGFDEDEVQDALRWLAQVGHAAGSPSALTAPAHTRIYTAEEAASLGAEPLKFLRMLEVNQAIDAPLRELVVAASLACEEQPLALEEFKLIMLLAHWQLRREPDDLLFDELCFEDDERTLH